MSSMADQFFPGNRPSVKFSLPRRFDSDTPIDRVFAAADNVELLPYIDQFKNRLGARVSEATIDPSIRQRLEPWRYEPNPQRVE